MHKRQEENGRLGGKRRSDRWKGESLSRFGRTGLAAEFVMNLASHHQNNQKQPHTHRCFPLGRLL